MGREGQDDDAEVSFPNTNTEERAGALWGCAIPLIALAIGFPLSALAISLTWNWFVAPFLSLPTMGTVTAIGVRMFVYTLWTPAIPKLDPNESRRDQLIVASVTGVAGPLIAIAFAAIWHSFA